MKADRFRSGWLCATAAALLPVSAAAAPAVDESKLPPPAQQKIEFARDIKPIFEKTCLRCHGPERPKSNFRLTDRAAALKGGENGVDIIPGQSAKSHLIHYVARLVEDMEMPPPGKGEPLTSNQVALLRAWIDQGVGWDDPNAAASVAPAVTASPAVSWTSVSGDRAKFRELEWRPEGWNGGLEEFDYHQRLADGRSASITGHAWRDDYKLTLDLRKPDLGFTRFGYEQFRKYYDDSGGYYAGFDPSAFSLGRDLHLDLGRAWAEVGLTLPSWPRIVAGYEYQFKDGDKSMLTWGPVTSPSGNFLDTRSIYPSVKNIDERTHIVRLEVSYNLRGFYLEDNLRFEFHDSDTRRTDALNVPAGAAGPNLVTQVRESYDHFQAANVFRVEKPVNAWWFLSAGYLYSWIDGESALRLQPENGAGQPAAGSAWSADEITLRQASQVANFNSQFLPFPKFTAALGVQGLWDHKESFGNANLDEVSDPNDPTAGIQRFPALVQSDFDRSAAEENVALRYSGIPFTALFAEARLRQEEFTQEKSEHGGAHDFLLDTDASSQWQEYRAGFNVSPWRLVSFTSHYKYRDREIDYDYPRDEQPSGSSSGPGYSGFIRARDLATDEVQARLTLNPAPWLKTSLTYQWLTTDYHTTTEATPASLVGPDATPGGRVYAGQYDANVFSANATVTPFRRLLLSATLSYQDSHITTADNGNRSVAPYRGDTWTVLANASYGLDERTRLIASYIFSRSDYGQNNAADGLPLGLEYTRHGVQAGVVRSLGKHLTARLQYGFFSYDEPSSGHLNDYTAHQVLAVLTLKWP